MPDRRSLLDLETVVDDTEIVVRAVGVFDVSTVDALVELVRAQLADGRPVVVDVYGVSMCDSTGLGGIVLPGARCSGATGFVRCPQPASAYVADHRDDRHRPCHPDR